MPELGYVVPEAHFAERDIVPELGYVVPEAHFAERDKTYKSRRMELPARWLHPFSVRIGGMTKRPNAAARSSSLPAFYLSTLTLFALFLSACTPSTPATPTPDMNAVQTAAVATVYAAAEQTAQAIPSATGTPTPAPTAIRTPPALPAGFTTSLLNPLDTPHTYIQDACQYLKAKWDPKNAAPGTVVMVVMIHGIAQVLPSPDRPQDIGNADFKKLMNDLKSQGFTAINMQQAFDFLDHNAKIPKRSVLLIQDDRHTAQNFNEIFRPYWDKWQWPVVNAWINANDEIGKGLLPDMLALSAEGWVDYQSHGVLHLPIDPSSSDEFIHGELYGSMQAMQQNFHKTPIAYIWAGGGFTPKAVQVARQAGYKLGFTINPRGPVMFDWVPQTDQVDPMRPSFLAEGPVNDPLLTLPRYWDTDARDHLDAVRNIGDAAADYAAKNKATELEYYDILCAPTYGAIP